MARSRLSLSWFTPMALLLAVAALVIAPHQALAAADAKLLAAAQAEQSAVVETVKQMVLIESGSQDLDGLAKMTNLIEQRLKALGFQTERRKVTQGPAADILVGTVRGIGRQRLMLQGHMDTVYEKGILESQPFKLDGNRVFGLGIADDKGGIAVILHALKILADANWRDYATITVLFNPDEEIGSRGSGELISQLADQHDTVLSFEPTAAKAIAPGESLLLGAAGTGLVTMEVKGRAAHAGAAPQLGRNAVIELSHQLVQTRDVAKDIPGVQLNWTRIKADQAGNQIPELAHATGDMRITVPGAELKLMEALQAKIASSQLVPDTKTTATMTIGRPSYLAGDKAKQLAAQAQSIYAELDRKLGLAPMTGGGTDAGFAARSGKAVVLESFGLAGWGFHARDEYIEIDSIVPRLYLVSRLIMDLSKR